MQCTQSEVVQVFGYFNCDDFGSHSIKHTNSLEFKLEFGDIPISLTQNTANVS